jgi:DNA-directed RNA polymerase subunit omega
MEIVSLPVVVDKEKIDSRFRFVVLATERAREIINGARPNIQTRYIKSSTIAIEELAECNVEYLTGKDARKAMQEASSTKVLRDLSVPGEGAEEDEKKKEIEQELGVYVPEPGDIKESGGGEE